MVEFHINYCEEFIDLIKGTHYGRLISFRFLDNKKSVMKIGHNECTFDRVQPKISPTI